MFFSEYSRNTIPTTITLQIYFQSRFSFQTYCVIRLFRNLIATNFEYTSTCIHTFLYIFTFIWNITETLFLKHSTIIFNKTKC